LVKKLIRRGSNSKFGSRWIKREKKLKVGGKVADFCERGVDQHWRRTRREEERKRGREGVSLEW
jgi:hypothetical protein